MDCLMQNERAWALGRRGTSRISHTETSLRSTRQPHFSGQLPKGPRTIWKSGDIMKPSLHRLVKTLTDLILCQVNRSMPLGEAENL
jgi:hypothetical protein